jgi:membrane protein DedA with SNARE-associated domain
MDPLLGMIHLERVVELMDIGIAGYFVLFGLLFSCGLGMPLPEDIPLLVSGMLVGQHRMHVWAVAICAWCGIIGGDCVLYFMGHRFGLNITKVPFVGKHISKERILQAEHLFEKYGFWVVAVGRLFAGIRGAMVVAAGTIRYNFLKFIIADGVAALVSGGLFVWLGIKFGENLKPIQRKIHEYSTLVFIALALIAIGFVVSFWLRKRRHARSAAELAADAIEQVVEEHKLHLPIPKASERHGAPPPPSDVPAK